MLEIVRAGPAFTSSQVIPMCRAENQAPAGRPLPGSTGNSTYLMGPCAASTDHKESTMVSTEGQATGASDPTFQAINPSTLASHSF